MWRRWQEGIEYRAAADSVAEQADGDDAEECGPGAGEGGGAEPDGGVERPD